jgi:uncharacterized protein
MPERLPSLFDPLEFAEKKRHITGAMALAGMERLRDQVMVAQGEAMIDLQFGREGRIPIITGLVSADLVLECQCCLEPIPWFVSADVRLGIVGSMDEADLLPPSMDPLLVDSGVDVALIDIVQDELLLCLPTVPQHADCGLEKPDKPSSGERNPFASLAQFKKN